MKVLSYFPHVLIICLLGLSACGGGEDDDGGGDCNYSWAAGVEAELSAITSAATDFSTDPSEANCNKYKSAIQAYITKLRPYGDCTLLTGVNRTNFQNALSQWETSVGALDCTP